MIKKIFKNSVLVLIPLAVISAFIEWKKLPASILMGGILGLVNIKGLAWGIEGLFGPAMMKGPMILFSLFRLAMIFLIIVLLLYLKFVNLIGILIGFSVIFMMVLIEGLKFAKSLNNK
jgi:hypothetical protein